MSIVVRGEEYEAVIGLEVHAQLLTESKIFCSCSTEFGAPPNTHTCPVCLGLPGVLPVVNKRAVEMAISAALAFNSEIAPCSMFARKNYFYPDLPKGYQISQFDKPFAAGGEFLIRTSEGERMSIRIARIHLEEDAGKSIHGGECTLVDMNRCGVPLLEIVSEPDIRSPAEAHAYLARLKQILEYIDICDGDMEKGSLRCDANVSIRPFGSDTLGTKTEIKNLNSFRFVERGIGAEIERQRKAIDLGEKITQETVLWDEHRQTVVPIRSKEEAHDYRYFPEPDLLPVNVSSGWVAEVRTILPELPSAREERFIEQYGLPPYDAALLTSTRPLADYFEACGAVHEDAKEVSNWVMGEVLRTVNETGVSMERFPVSPGRLGELLGLIALGRVSGRTAKTIFQEMLASKESAEDIVQRKGLSQISDEREVQRIVDQAINENPRPVADYLAGKEKTFGFLVGQVMRFSEGRANPAMVNAVLRSTLESLAKDGLDHK